MKCTLCESSKIKEFFQVKEKAYGQYISKLYYHCDECQLIFLDPELHLNSKDEKARYDTHENNIENEKYKEFLLQSWTPLKALLDRADKTKKTGLDFGCGPSPVLAGLVGATYPCKKYDPYFFNNKELLTYNYDFVLSTEVFEHFNSPKESIEKVISLLKSGAYLSVMTSFFHKGIDFKNWRYRQDQTHVCFYSESTIEWIAKKYSLDIIYIANPVVIFKKI